MKFPPALALISAMAIFGSMGIFVRFTGLNGLIIAAIAFMFSSVCLLPLLLRKKLLNRKLIRKEAWFLVGIAFMGILNNVSYFISFSYTTIAAATFLHYLAPVIAIVLAIFFLKESFSIKKGIAIGFSLLGLACVTGFTLSGQSFIGNMFAILSAVGYGVGIILYKKAMETYDNLVIIFSQMFWGALLLSPLVFIMDFTVTLPVIGILAILGIVHQFTAVLIHFYSIRNLSVFVLGILSYSEVLFAILFAFLVFAEIPAILTFVGGGFIVVASLLTLGES
jgi:drug/metabolite transporter (DMT)-like permease